MLAVPTSLAQGVFYPQTNADLPSLVTNFVHLSTTPAQGVFDTLGELCSKAFRVMLFADKTFG